MAFIKDSVTAVWWWTQNDFYIVPSPRLSPLFPPLSLQLVIASLSWAFQHQDIPPKYQYRDPVTSDVLMCDQCPPGTAVKRHCTADSPTECHACPQDHFAESWHWGDSCKYCTSVRPKNHRRSWPVLPNLLTGVGGLVSDRLVLIQDQLCASMTPCCNLCEWVLCVCWWWCSLVLRCARSVSLLSTNATAPTTSCVSALQAST